MVFSIFWPFPGVLRGRLGLSQKEPFFSVCAGLTPSLSKVLAPVIGVRHEGIAERLGQLDHGHRPTGALLQFVAEKESVGDEEWRRGWGCQEVKEEPTTPSPHGLQLKQGGDQVFSGQPSDMSLCIDFQKCVQGVNAMFGCSCRKKPMS